MNGSEASQLLVDAVRGYLRGLVNASREFEKRGPDSLAVNSGELASELSVAEDLLLFEQIVERNFARVEGVVDGGHGSTHEASPSGSDSAALTADVSKRTVGDAAGTHTTPSGVSADPSQPSP